MAAHVVMYAKRTCPYCHRAERLLRERGVNDLELIFIDQDPSRRPEMIERANGRTTVPQIFIGGQHVGGSDDLAALDRAGKLSPMLAWGAEPLPISLHQPPSPAWQKKTATRSSRSSACT